MVTAAPAATGAEPTAPPVKVPPRLRHRREAALPHKIRTTTPRSIEKKRHVAAYWGRSFPTRGVTADRTRDADDAQAADAAVPVQGSGADDAP